MPPTSAARRPARGRGNPRNARGERDARWRGRSGCADLLAATPPYHHAGEKENGGDASEDAPVLRDEMEHSLPIAADREAYVTDGSVPYRRSASDGESSAQRRHAQGARERRHQGANARNEATREEREDAILAVHLAESVIGSGRLVAEQALLELGRAVATAEGVHDHGTADVAHPGGEE